jgi:hypothetical protein
MPFRCDPCGKDFVHLTHYNQHKKGKTHAQVVSRQNTSSQNTSSWKCGTCNKTFGMECHLTRHINKESHKSEPESDGHPQKRQCSCFIDGCAKLYKRQPNLNTHIQQQHPTYIRLDENTFTTCDICAKDGEYAAFTTTEHHKAHDKKFHSQENAPPAGEASTAPIAGSSSGYAGFEALTKVWKEGEYHPQCPNLNSECDFCTSSQ